MRIGLRVPQTSLSVETTRRSDPRPGGRRHRRQPVGTTDSLNNRVLKPGHGAPIERQQGRQSRLDPVHAGLDEN
jgi:hypothetical protein